MEDEVGATKKLLLLILALLVVSSAAQAGLEQYRELVQQDANPCAPAPSSGVRITYLGTNAYLLEAREAVLLVDPYFSRMSLLRFVLNLPAVSQRQLVERHLRGRRIDAVLATHGHCDHLLDVPEAMRLTGARLIASPTSARIVRSLGLPADRCITTTGGDSVRIRDAIVHSVAVRHDRLLCCVPFDGPPRRLPPRKVSDWVCGEPLAFLIEMGGKRIYIESGGQPDRAIPAVGHVDLAILGVALPDARARFPQAVRALCPRYVLPSHQDDFLRPLSCGFVFGPMTDFPGVRRAFRDAPARSRLILLDYFRPWTLR